MVSSLLLWLALVLPQAVVEGISTPEDVLSQQVGGRLHLGLPFSAPCFSNVDGVGQPIDAGACSTVQQAYTNRFVRTTNPGSRLMTQWETCQTTGAQCLLNSTNPMSTVPTAPPAKCMQGSIPTRYLDVQRPEDVSAAFNYSKITGVPIVIHNTGHDNKGRGSAPDSLALWTHNLKSLSYSARFTPTGCKNSFSAITMGAGVQWAEAYAFADKNGVTVVGGSDSTVGASGGWLQGGGHGMLSNTLGLGVDRVLQFKVVTPDGQYLTANTCQNSDLFFALRGGGGGTFGVVMESTTLASPAMKIQSFIFEIPNATQDQLEAVFSIIIENSVLWANRGWGGRISGTTAVYINPVLDSASAQQDLAPLIDYAATVQSFGGKAVSTFHEYPNWKAFYDVFAASYLSDVGSNLALSSRLVPRGNFGTHQGRSALLVYMLSAFKATPSMVLLATAPSSFPGDGTTSVTPAWRDSIFHVTFAFPYAYNSSPTEARAVYAAASSAADNLRLFTPDAAYVNEADVYEPNHEVSFWGKNYPKLLAIKQKYDPDHLLDCWQCVGWNPSSSRFSCYLK